IEVVRQEQTHGFYLAIRQIYPVESSMSLRTLLLLSLFCGWPSNSADALGAAGQIHRNIHRVLEPKGSSRVAMFEDWTGPDVFQALYEASSQGFRAGVVVMQRLVQFAAHLLCKR